MEKYNKILRARLPTTQYMKQSPPSNNRPRPVFEEYGIQAFTPLRQLNIIGQINGQVLLLKR